MTIGQNELKSETARLGMEYVLVQSAYPINMSEFLTLSEYRLDVVGVSCCDNSAEYHPAIITRHALAHWNEYVVTQEERERIIFLTQAQWLVDHEVEIGDDAGGWPHVASHPDVSPGDSWLSALTQGCGISVLIRAYVLTGKSAFLAVTQRVVRTFERDILDGGVSAPIGEDGIFFEEVAVYPASHRLSGYIQALIGLYDYVAVTGDTSTEERIQHSLATLHLLIDEFDVGFWTYGDLLHRPLASSVELELQIELLKVLARYTGCEHCSMLALRWSNYHRSALTRLRYCISSRLASFGGAVLSRVRKVFFPRPGSVHPVRICVPITSFPFRGGIMTVLDGITRVMQNQWHIEYMAQIIGPGADRYTLHRFGSRLTAPWHFPLVWLHVLVGVRKLIALLYKSDSYHVILPQDGVFTAIYAAIAGKLAGARVVCIDHSTLTWTRSHLYRAEREATVHRKSWPRAMKLGVLLMLKFYWPSLALLARMASRLVDHYLIPGVPGDEVEQVCNRLGVPISRLTRFASMIDIHRHIVFSREERACMRKKKGLPEDAIVIAIICRLAPEKGLEVAFEAISQVLSSCSVELRARIRVVTAGDGPLRSQVEEDIQRRGLHQACLMWGNISPDEVIALLGITDIFLYTSVRGACFPMSVLEAMASGCAVIASTQPMSNAHLLAEGRGLAVSEGNVAQTSVALLRIVNDLKLCQQMGGLAREYIAQQHSPDIFKRTLLRATKWSGLNMLLGRKAMDEPISAAKSEC
jgi:glycosyltransferase involved in cell wall biosynthesis